MNNRTRALALAFSLSLLAPAYVQAATTDNTGLLMSPEQAREEQAYVLGVQAYLWGYPLYHYDISGEKSRQVGAVGVNSLRKFTALKTAKERFVVTPNNVTIDAYGHLFLAQEPVVVHVPALTEPRWYLVQIGNSFDEVTFNVGGIKGARPGDYLITGPDYRGSVPNGMTQVPLRTEKGIVAVRILAKDETDIDAAVQAQKGFQVMPLSAYLRQGLQYQPGKPQLPPDFSASAPANLRFFERLGHAMQQSLPLSGDRDEGLLTAFNQIGLSVANGFAWQTLDDATRRGLARAAKAAEQIVDQRWKDVGETTNGWRYTLAGGRAGHDFALRAALAKNVVGAQLSEEVVYPNTRVDAKGAALNGQNAYVLRFAKGQLPPVSLFWNLSLYGDDMLFVENAFGRNSIGNLTEGLKPDADGSLTLLIQKERPADTANWLPAPEGDFNLTMRFYGPATSVLDGSYRLPAVERVD
ncbi:DUF1214 domain-containing protein [Pseudomonas sp. GD03860]|uniref:DUF1254 domain-containing protein n=1 Tax=Pseudomonas TaxID=286 RepID=UPI0023646E4A|nr:MULTISPECIES: DUF1214 domain-containing protein [Pseudomonas]MDD2058494.1 DUF1214 domain-containing protein [Pseudomonas putida]MDH0640834.1 DUF1214 domain-containing protein [Pseudomonas sp. GD03860]